MCGMVGMVWYSAIFYSLFLLISSEKWDVVARCLPMLPFPCLVCMKSLFLCLYAPLLLRLLLSLCSYSNMYVCSVHVI